MTAPDNNVAGALRRRRCLACLGIASSLLGAAMPASAAAPPLQERGAAMQCADRRIAIEAACFPAEGRSLACTRQAIRFFGADGKPLGARVFQSAPIQQGDAYPVVEAKFGALECVETREKKKFVVASMVNGGNCEQCEWDDVYAPDGALVGSTRAGKTSRAALERGFGALYDKSRRVLAHQDLAQLYAVKAVTPAAAVVQTPAAFACPVDSRKPQPVSQEQVFAVLGALNTAFDAALGPDARHVDQSAVLARLAASTVDTQRMAHLAEVTGCAALIDVQSSCANYFDPELGDPLSVFMGMKKTAPLRRQFEAAVARVTDPPSRRAALACIKLVGVR